MNTSPSFGEYFRMKRLEQKMSLRAFCERYGLDSAYISRLENSKLKPPTGDNLIGLAEALNLTKGSPEWLTFFDLAHQAKNEIPSDIQRDAAEVIVKLPAFLRTPDGRRVSKEKVEKLIDFLERDGQE